MNEKDMNALLERDNILREAISRREQRQPSRPSDLNARLMQRMKQADEKPKRRIWLYVVSGVAASILLLLTFSPPTPKGGGLTQRQIKKQARFASDETDKN